LTSCSAAEALKTTEMATCDQFHHGTIVLRSFVL